jgi:hypothetical protein
MALRNGRRKLYDLFNSRRRDSRDSCSNTMFYSARADVSLTARNGRVFPEVRACNDNDCTLGSAELEGPLSFTNNQGTCEGAFGVHL